MPQLDIYTYFTQFQWLLIIFTLLFLLINGQFLPTFQSLFEARNALIGISPLRVNENNQENKSSVINLPEGLGLKVFEFERPKISYKEVSDKKGYEKLATDLEKWEKIYDRNRTLRSTRGSIKTAPLTAPIMAQNNVPSNRRNKSNASQKTSNKKD